MISPLKSITGHIGQWLGALGTIGGTYWQIRDHGKWLTAVVMVAAFAWGIATKVKYYKAIAEAKKRCIE